jgi:hypothetical protein
VNPRGFDLTPSWPAFDPPPKQVPQDFDCTDLEYREAALHAAIAHFEAKNQPRVQEWEIVKTAQHFEQYLRHG